MDYSGPTFAFTVMASAIYDLKTIFKRKRTQVWHREAAANEMHTHRLMTR